MGFCARESLLLLSRKIVGEEEGNCVFLSLFLQLVSPQSFVCTVQHSTKKAIDCEARLSNNNYSFIASKLQLSKRIFFASFLLPDYPRHTNKSGGKNGCTSIYHLYLTAPSISQISMKKSCKKVINYSGILIYLHCILGDSKGQYFYCLIFSSFS